MKLSILTATYNRAGTIGNLYQSLLKSPNRDQIEWIIMNDGSTDNTIELVKQWQDDGKIDIQYYEQVNQGKMAALNHIVSYASGDFLVECDSDDYLDSDFYEKIEEASRNLPADCYGMFFLKMNQDYQLIGKPFPKEYEVHTLFSFYHELGVTGDKAIVFKTECRKQFYYRLEHGERFVTEGRLFHEMDLHYQGLYPINQVLMICEYQNDGYSLNIQKIFKENPYGYYQYFYEMFQFSMRKVTFKKRLYILKHYILFSYLTGKTKRQVIINSRGFFNHILLLLLVVPGYYRSQKF